MKSADKQISDFLEIAVGQSRETATKLLTLTNWNVGKAINLFLSDQSQPPYQNQFSDYDQKELFSSYDQEEHFLQPESVSVGTESRLSSMYRAPENLRFYGSFEDAKLASYKKNLWLLVNLQSQTEFACHALNRDLWSNDTVSETVKPNFIFSQIYVGTIEGQKVSSFYKIKSPPPVVLLIDPITGGKMRMWSGDIYPQDFLEELIKYIDDGPHQYIASHTRNLCNKTEKINLGSSDPDDELPSEKRETCSSSHHVDSVATDPSCGEHGEDKEATTFSPSNQIGTCLEFPDLTEEPKGDCDRSTVCSVCIRFPDGRRKQRKFLKTEPIQLLWSFCYSHMEEGSDKMAFKLVQAIPGASRTLDYGDNVSFDQSRLANSMISVTWE